MALPKCAECWPIARRTLPVASLNALSPILFGNDVYCLPLTSKRYSLLNLSAVRRVNPVGAADGSNHKIVGSIGWRVVDIRTERDYRLLDLGTRA